MTNLNYLVLLDTDRIKDYLFSTNKLKEIRGASAILDTLNREQTPKILYENTIYGKGNLKREAGQYVIDWSETQALDWQMVYFDGGAVQILFKDEGKANQFCTKIEKLYHDQTDGIASTTGVVVERYGNESFPDWVERGHKALRRRKDSKYLRLSPLSSPHFKSCESSGVYVAEKYDSGVTPRFIHQSVSKKRERSDEGIVKEFREYAQSMEEAFAEKWKNAPNVLSPDDLNEVGEPSRGYVGFIYADGNRMGSRFKNQKNPEDYHGLSQMIQNGTRKAIFNAILKHRRFVSFFENNEQKWRLLFQILMLGGDDLMIVVPADKAVELAIDFCDTFKSLTKDEQHPNGISISAGVLITHANYPIHLMMAHAEELLKSAKKKSNNEDGEVCTIDYMVLKGALLGELKAMRRREMEIPTPSHLKLYQRPYTTEKLAQLIRWIRCFKASQFPHSRLKSIYQSLYRGKGQATIELCLMMTRLEKGEGRAREAIDQFRQDYNLNFFPWKKIEEDNEYVTPFIDLIELYDFIDEKEVPRDTPDSDNHAGD
jgi:hypothetical protein